MGYKRYEKYKDSGVEWIGEIPEHWEVKKLKFITRIFYGDSLPIENREEGDINVFGSNGIIGTHNMPNTLSPAIIIGRKGSFGKVTFSERECFAIDTTYFIDQRATKTNLKWLFYLLQLLELDKNSQDTGVPGLSREYAYNLYAILPCSEEQTAIAHFLDQKTAEIDSLIADKEKMIQLLQEKRQSIINEAVTKGLDPNVPMQDSGVEWIGEIPEKWEITKAKRLFFIANGATPQSSIEDYWDGDIIWVTPVDLSTSSEPYIYDSLRKITRKGLENCSTKIVPEGSLILSTRAPIGYVKIAGKKLCTNQGCKALVPIRKLCEKFFYYYVLVINSYIKTLGQGTTFTELSNEALANILFVFPPYNEQTAIANFLDHKTAEIDSLISDIQTQIAKLKEYRQSLIYEVVTGKIDVQGYNFSN